MVNFGLRQLSQFIAIAEVGSYRGAAESLFIAQPALSVSIRKLEEALGVQLFDRGARGVTLTPAGDAFLVEARRSLLHAEQGRQSARLAALGEWGVVRLGFVGSAVYRLLPQTLPSFIARYPGVRLELQEATTVSILDMLRDGKLDGGVIRPPVEDASDLHLQALETDDLIAALPRTHPLARRRRIDLTALGDESFVMFSKVQVPGLRAAVVERCREAGFTPRVTQEATQALTVVGLVGSGLGVALVPSVIARFTHAQVRFVPLSNPGTKRCLTLALATRREGVSAATLKLRELIEREARARGGKNSVKLTDKPDSVHPQHLAVLKDVTAINLGRWSPNRLGATYPPTPGAPSTLAYLVLLRVEIARFTQVGLCPTWVLCFPGLRRERLACAIRVPACAGTAQTTLPGSTLDLTRLCCSDPHLTVDSR